jgi:predicted porin
MKKLLLTTGLASAVLFSANAMAEVKVGAVLEWNIGSSEVASTGTKDSGPTAIGFSTELDISSTKTLSNGMILSLHAEMMDNTAGFTDVGFNLTSGNVRFHIGQDDLAIGDSDVVPKVGEAFDSSLLNGIAYSASKGTTHANATIGGVYTTPVGSFQVGYQPQGGTGLGSHGGGLDTVASGGSSYEVGFFGNLGVEGLSTKLVRVVDQPADDTAALEDITSLQYGVAYNFGKVSVGAHRIDYDGSAVTADDETHTGIGATFAASDQLSFGVEMTKMEKDGTASDEDGLSVGVGYDLGGLVITAQYLEIENAGGTTGKDAEAFLIRTVAAF